MAWAPPHRDAWGYIVGGGGGRAEVPAELSAEVPAEVPAELSAESAHVVYSDAERLRLWVQDAARRQWARMMNPRDERTVPVAGAVGGFGPPLYDGARDGRVADGALDADGFLAGSNGPAVSSAAIDWDEMSFLGEALHPLGARDDDGILRGETRPLGSGSVAGEVGTMPWSAARIRGGEMSLEHTVPRASEADEALIEARLRSLFGNRDGRGGRDGRDGLLLRRGRTM